MNSLNIGLDVDLRKVIACIVDENGTRLGKPFSFPNTPEGAEKFFKAIQQILLKEKNISSLKFGTESTGIYDWHLANFLAQKGESSPCKVEVYRLNALRVNRFRKSLPEFNKTDRIDAEILAHYLRISSALPFPHVPSDPYHPLRILTRYRFHLVKNIVRETNTFFSYIFLQASRILQNKPSRITGKTLSTILSSFSQEEIVSMPLQKLEDIIVKESKNRYPQPSQVAQIIQSAIRESYRLRPELSRTINFVLSHQVYTLRTLRSLLKEVNKAISSELASFPQTLTSIPGVSTVLAAGIIAEIGDIRKFSSHNQLAKLAGYVWPEKQSGQFRAEDRKMPRSANKYLRYYLAEAANLVRKYDPVFSAYYWKKYKEARTHHHKRALALTTRKFIRLVFSLLSTNQPYQRRRNVCP